MTAASAHALTNYEKCAWEESFTSPNPEIFSIRPKTERLTFIGTKTVGKAPQT